MKNFEDYCQIVQENIAKLSEIAPHINRAVDMVVKTISNGGKLILCGNGGSAADSQHLAAEFMGRFLMERNPLPAIALTVDTSILTSIGNDYSFEEVFSRQIRGLGREGDLLIAISTSGNSRNVIAAIEDAKKLSITTIGLTGIYGGELAKICDLSICVPSYQTNHIQEMHILVGHYICSEVERINFKN